MDIMSSSIPSIEGYNLALIICGDVSMYRSTYEDMVRKTKVMPMLQLGNGSVILQTSEPDFSCRYGFETMVEN